MVTKEEAIKWLANLKGDIGYSHDDLQAIYEIIDLLKEQEAVPPLVTRLLVPTFTATSCCVRKKYYCGACRQEMDKTAQYCCRCGRKVKWDETD